MIDLESSNRVSEAMADALVRVREPGTEVRVKFDDSGEMKIAGSSAYGILQALGTVDEVKTKAANPPTDPTLDFVIELRNGSCLILLPSERLLVKLREAGYGIVDRPTT